jgi:hypothetical protein
MQQFSCQLARILKIPQGAVFEGLQKKTRISGITIQHGKRAK